MSAGPARPDLPVPAAVAELAGGPALPVWQNDAGGVVFQVTSGRPRFIKWAPAASGTDLTAEAARLTWAITFARVPELLDQGRDQDGSWIITAALPGQMAVTARWKNDPARAVAAIGEGLRALHEAAPAGQCPFSWSAGDRLAEITARAEAGLLDPARWHPEHRQLGAAAALALLADPPPADRQVTCHGDPCAPNTLISDDGTFSGHVDLGSLGTADRWADLAVATWSTTWNYGPRWEKRLLDAYGTSPDPDRTRYYRLLYDLGP
jgi:kanamycin kinase